MRININIDIDDDLLAEAAEIAGTTTKESTVETALRELIRRHVEKKDTRIARQLRLGGRPAGDAPKPLLVIELDDRELAQKDISPRSRWLGWIRWTTYGSLRHCIAPGARLASRFAPPPTV